MTVIVHATDLAVYAADRLIWPARRSGKTAASDAVAAYYRALFAYTPTRHQMMQARRWWGKRAKRGRRS